MIPQMPFRFYGSLEGSFLTAAEPTTYAYSPRSSVYSSSTTLRGEQGSLGNIVVALFVAFLVAQEANERPPVVVRFYHIPSNINWTSSIPAGTVFAVENVTNTSLYTLPAPISMSRIIYQTATINGTNVPASAYVLWPYLPRTFPNVTGLPVIGWGHGTSGVLPDCGPSHIRNLWYQFAGPYEMAMQGYVVVAPDYAGLGVSSTGPAPPPSSSPNTTSDSSSSSSSSDDDPNRILHPYLSNPSHGLDILHAVRAARAAFPSLSTSHVVIGHSQGGGAAWGAAVEAAKHPQSFPGYLGAVAGSPAPSGANYLTLLSAATASYSPLAAYIAMGVHAAYPAVALDELFTPAGLARFELMRELGGCSSVATELFAVGDGGEQTPWVRPDIADFWATRAFAGATDYVGEDVGGVETPLLVLQGDADSIVVPGQTAESVRRACEANAESSVELVSFENVTHVPVMFAGQRVWLDWVADRFNGVPVEKGCRNRTLSPLRREEGAYLEETNFVLEWVTQGYQTA
ncbi:putative secretory protein [Lasiodiplodia theobromae]|nr:putative secretory protein [Lasiodiplodia theobromae]